MSCPLGYNHVNAPADEVPSMSAPVLSPAELRSAVDRLPRAPLAHLPTPLEEAPRLSQRLGGRVRVLLKRDDCTGLLLGGNKTRHNEFLVGDALARGADLLVWGAGAQSNNCRQTAAACAKHGLECRLYLSRGNYPSAVQGNLLLDYLVGAKVEMVPEHIGPELDALLQAKAEAFRREGRKVYVWDRPVVVPLAAVSYALCWAEIIEQCQSLGLEPTAVYVASAGSTGAGLALGRALLGSQTALRSICPIDWPWDTPADMAATATRAAAQIGQPHQLSRDDIDATEEYIGTAYGRPSPAGQAALRLLASTEGVLLDPIYTAKALAGLIADVEAGRWPDGSVVVLVHTGGTPAVFAYAEEMLDTAG